MLRNHFHLARLVSGFLAETLTPEEKQELQAWRDASPENERLFKQICHPDNLQKHIRESQSFEKEAGWDHLNKKINHTIRRARWRNALGYAATILLPLMVGAFIWLSQQEADKILLADDNPKIEQILPGERRAILTLGSGEVIDLQAATQHEVSEADGTTIDIRESTLNYQTDEKKKESGKVIYNKVDVPRGGEYSLFLADGTKVYLNAMSSLRFPVQFTGERRVVELEGEAYFEVSANSKPFIVKSEGKEIEVLGTTFNVSAYPEDIFHTTLITGSVKVSSEKFNTSCTLKPSEQVRLGEDSEEFDISQVDVTLYTSWINGKIYFRDIELEEIMRSLSRWYEMEVEYGNERARKMRFGCHVDRYADISPFLELLEQTGKVKVKREGNKIIFTL